MTKEYLIEIPDIIFNLNLKVYEFKLYCVIKKIESEDGVCCCSYNNLANLCGFSKNQVIRSMAILTRPNKKLGDQPLITLQHRKKENGESDTNIIHTIKDFEKKE